MTADLHVSFWLNTGRIDKNKKSPLIIRLTCQGARKQINTQFRLTPGEWKKIQQNGKILSALSHVKEFIASFTASAYKLSSKMQLNGDFDLDRLVDELTGKKTIKITLLNAIQEHNKLFEERVGLDRAKSTLEKYLYLKDKVEKFIDAAYNKADLMVHALPSSLMQDFVHYLATVDKIQHNTITKYVKNLKHILNFIQEKGYPVNIPFSQFKIGYKDIERSYLSMTELKQLANYQFANPKYEMVRDLFLFQCYTGLSYSDMASLTTNCIIEGLDQKPWIRTFRIKTDQQSLIPLLPIPLQIIQKYQGKGKNDHLLPTYSIQKFNLFLKELAEVVGINKMFSSHAGRRTFATTVALGNGVSIESISKVLGHSSTKMTKMYAVVTDEKLSREINELSIKLNNK